MRYLSISILLPIIAVVLVLVPAAALFNDTKSSVDPKLGTDLTRLYKDHVLTILQGDAAADAAEEAYVAVDITFTTVMTDALAKELLSPVVTTIDFIACFGVQCSTRLPVSTLTLVAQLDAVHALRRVQARTNVVRSEGDTAMFANTARAKFAVNGSGLLIGVLSDSYNCLGGAANDVAAGELPKTPAVLVVADLKAGSECVTEGATDEGRAMLQLIYDVAPGARLAFRTGNRGQADFAAGILASAQAGCDIIVDDLSYYAEPMFQDGVIAQAVDQVVAQGVAFFSSAGNEARKSWVAAGGFVAAKNNPTFHQFGTDSKGAPITKLRISMSGSSNPRVMVFQWDEPFFSTSGGTGSRSDIDVYFLLNGRYVAGGEDYNIGADPVEVFSFTPSKFSTASTVTVDFVIINRSGPAPKYMKLVVYGQVTSFEFATNSSTVYGHSNAAFCAGVGAASYKNTPAYGVTPPKVESYSSAGGTPILFSKTGTRLSAPVIRNQPRFTGPDGGATSFFGDLISGVYRFFGTSAAAPHVAAVAALMLQYKGGKRSMMVSAIYSTLASTAIDMDNPYTTGFSAGFDFITGTGLVNATAALNALGPRVPIKAPVPTPVAPTPVKVPVRTPVALTPVRVPVRAPKAQMQM